MGSINRVFLPVISKRCRVRSGPFQIQNWRDEKSGCSMSVVDVRSKSSKIVYRISESNGMFEVIMRLPVLYRSSEDGFYQSSVPSCPFKEMSSSKRPISDPKLESREVRL